MTMLSVSIKLITSKLADAILEGKQLKENKATETSKIEKSLLLMLV